MRYIAVAAMRLPTMLGRMLAGVALCAWGSGVALGFGIEGHRVAGGTCAQEFLFANPLYGSRLHKGLSVRAGADFFDAGAGVM